MSLRLNWKRERETEREREREREILSDSKILYLLLKYKECLGGRGGGAEVKTL